MVKIEHGKANKESGTSMFLLTFVAVLMGLILFPMEEAWGQLKSSYEVRWVSQCPAENSVDKKAFGKRISEVVFGRRPQELMKPFSVFPYGKEHYVMADQGRGTIFEFKNGRLSTLKGLTKDTPPFPSLVGMTEIADGELLFTDSRLNKIFSIKEQELSSFSDTLTLLQPTGIALSKRKGEIWVVETGGHRITVLNMEGKVLKRIGGRGATSGTFNYPTFIWIDNSGKVYIVDSMNFRIQVLDPEGNFLHEFGKNGDASGSMARPKGIATDSRGHIYVADALFHVIQIFDVEGNFLYSFGGQGQGRGEFWLPAGIYIDERDHIYVADSYNSRVQTFKLEEK